MEAQELRRVWRQFFEDKQHTFVASAGLIPHHPTAPMFTNSGMMQFVPYFLGEETPPFHPRRAASVQKCMRAGGKHNDLDAIGRSPRHLSFFEMLGNFSFGDYFKEEAIAWAWEFVTEALGLDGDRVWVTCHVSDDDAVAIWTDVVGLAPDRIQRLGQDVHAPHFDDKENFWEMGETGPCGPSSELFWDFGPEHGPDGGPANPEAEHRFVECWNLVFQDQFRHPDGSLTPLTNRNVDTGAGLERILGLFAGSPSLYAADSVSRLVDAAQSVTGHRLGETEQSDIALRLLADHARSMTFLIADGVIPSNEGSGYVLRRIIRRAIRFAYLLGVEQAVTPPLAEATIEVMGSAYGELEANRDLIQGVLSREEDQFRRTLRTGLGILDAELAHLPEAGTVAGSVAFQLHDTYGFPLEVTAEIAQDRGYGLDTGGFEAAMAEQRDRARKAGRKVGAADATTDLLALDLVPTEFTGRSENESKATVMAVLPGAGPEGQVSIVLDRTPFYAESGGQVGDTGAITTDTGRAEVLDTISPVGGLHQHIARITEGSIEPGQEALATIDAERRDAIRRNHTGTHILHWALRLVLGEHVKQQGSHVDPDRLRFDFSHFEPVSSEQLREIEDLANHEILDNAPVHHYETTKEQAVELGAIAFFGDKYGDIVRVLEAGRHSIELCGGTHVRALGDIGPLKVVSENSIGSNLRRIEAITGTGPIDRIRAGESQLAEAAELLGVPVGELSDGIRKRLADLKALREQVGLLKRQAASGAAGDLAEGAVDGVVVARVDGLDRNATRDLAVALRDKPGIRAVILGSAPDSGGVALVAAVTPDSGMNAATLIAEAAKTVKGGGGKDPLLAAAGGKDPSQLDAALDQVRAAAGIAAS